MMACVKHSDMLLKTKTWQVLRHTKLSHWLEQVVVQFDADVPALHLVGGLRSRELLNHTWTKPCQQS